MKTLVISCTHYIPYLVFGLFYLLSCSLPSFYSLSANFILRYCFIYFSMTATCHIRHMPPRHSIPSIFYFPRIFVSSSFSLASFCPYFCPIRVLIFILFYFKIASICVRPGGGNPSTALGCDPARPRGQVQDKASFHHHKEGHCIYDI